MKIAFILPVNMSKFGYSKKNFIGSHFSVDIAREIAKKGHDVSLHTFWDKYSVINDKGLKIYFYPTSLNKIFKYDFSEISLKLFRKKFSQDTIIFFHEPNRLFFNLFILNHQNKIIITHHGNGIVNPMPYPTVMWFLYGIIRRFFLARSLKRTDAVILLNDIAVRSFKSYGIDENKIYKINNGIRTEKFKILDKKTARRLLGYSDNHILFLFVGRINEQKGIRELISAFQKIEDINSNSKLIIIGPLEDSKLKELVEPYWKGFKNPNELQKWFSMADVFVLPSYAEPYGNVLTEALFYNLPIITTNTAGPPEFVPKDNAIFIAPRSVKSLSEAMNNMLNADFRFKKSKGGNKLVKQKYTWEKVSQKYLQIFEKIETNH